MNTSDNETDSQATRSPALNSHMQRPYERVVTDLGAAFPKPVSDRMHDAYFVFSFLRTLDQVDELKSVPPLLGERVDAEYGPLNAAVLWTNHKLRKK